MNLPFDLWWQNVLFLVLCLALTVCNCNIIRIFIDWFDTWYDKHFK